MSKNIVLCSDGTGQAGGQGYVSNVWRLFKAVDRHSPGKNQTKNQIVFHVDGVGSEQGKVMRILGGALGVGLGNDMRQLYATLVRSYKPGDKIFLFGFSRGAFTVRSLAGMIHHVGILDVTPDKVDAAVKTAYKAYRKQENPDVSKEYDLHKERSIEFVGVWDTVDAIGVPFDELREMYYALPNALVRKHRAELNSSILNAYHAMSIDDERKTFHPMVWDESGFKGTKDKNGNERQVKQVWFAGVHSNVGGGYPKDSLSYISLDWMMSKANKCGLVFLDSKWKSYGSIKDFGDYQEQADKNGRIYDSRGGGGVYYRYKPRDMDELWKKSKTGEPATVHESALMRIQAGSTAYAPTAITGDFETVPTHSSDIQPITDRPDLGDAWHAICWRRVLYYGLVIWTLAFVLAGVFMDNKAGDPCEGNAVCIGLTGVFKGMLPDFTYEWIDSFGANGIAFWGFMGVLTVMAIVRKKLKRATESAASQAWSKVTIEPK